MKITIFFIIIFLIQFIGFSQEKEDAWVYFKDKPSADSYFSNPLAMLTQRAIDRRTKQAIVLDIKDVPLEPSYVSAIASQQGVVIKARSKWLNALHVQGSKDAIDLLLTITVVDSIDYGHKPLNKSILKTIKKSNKFSEVFEESELDYGSTSNQLTMLKGDYLHDLGYTGEGYQIAVIDAGFKGVESFDAFSRLLDSNLSNGEILGGYDFVNRSTNFYMNTGSTHGLSVLSTMGAFIESMFIGSAPNAQYYLFVTEDPSNESLLEESLWVEAAERADSLGVDIINTSLGYTTFDDASYDYTYADMDGKTTFITRGGEIASSRGIILVTSAGNSGNSSWKYIGAPGDAASTLTVGAVDENELIANFSSYGPSYDNRIKPEVIAQGKNVYVINSLGNVAISSGTSFSGPIMAGMIACLWQCCPTKTASEIKQLIVESGEFYANPTAQKGYGIPDFQKISNTLFIENYIDGVVQLFPNPIDDFVEINIPNRIGEIEIIIYDLSGKIIFEKVLKNYESTINIEMLDSGIYLMKLKLYDGFKTVKLLKK